MKFSSYINLIVWLNFLLMLGSCTEDQLASTGYGGDSTVTLHLPNVTDVGIDTRAISDENAIDELMVVLFRDGKAKFQSFSHPVVSGNQVSLTITKFDVQSGETLYICCNSGITNVTAESVEALADELVCTNNSTGMIMWGSGTFSGTNVSIDLKRVYAKANVSCTTQGITVESWKVCNVPSQGYVAETKTGYPAVTTFTETVNPVGNDVGNAAYFVPRTNNNSVSGTINKTYLLVKLAGLGWYRLDFYNQKSALEPSKDVPVLDIQRNTHYMFSITDVNSSGYATEEEAAANDGYNIIYDMDIITGHGGSNGQYSIILDREKILLHPVDGNGSNTMEILNVSAYIPKPENVISTYKVRLVNPNKQFVLLNEKDDEVEEIDLLSPNETLTTGNSSRTIRMKYSGANAYGTYLEIRLGNIVKKVPINVETSNCYLMDFATSANQTLYIPVLQANLDGVERITADDDLEPFIVWSDKAEVTKDNLELIYEKDKLRIKVTNKVAFSGNVVIAVKKDGVIKWSWHIWSMDDTVLTFNSALNIYDFKEEHENKFNGLTFMDRNLGACTLVKDGRSSDWGLLYQFGRKDPFPGSADGTTTEQTIYYEGVAFTVSGQHPALGACVVDVNSTNNLEYSIQNPSKFIKGMELYAEDGSDYNLDWYTNDYKLMDNNLWLTGVREKTAYNPCPSGWVTPYGGMIGPWYGTHISHATVDSNGLSLPDAGYFPFAPCRGRDGGIDYYSQDKSNTNLVLRWGNITFRISSTVFGMNDITGANETLRGLGCQVRCVRE